MPRTLTLRLTDEQEQQLLDYMDSQQLTVASKALLRALNEAQRLAQVESEQRSRIVELNARLADRQAALADLETAMARGLELLQQRDIFAG